MSGGWYSHMLILLPATWNASPPPEEISHESIWDEANNTAKIQQERGGYKIIFKSKLKQQNVSFAHQALQQQFQIWSKAVKYVNLNFF